MTSDTEVPLFVTVVCRTQNGKRSVELTGSLTMHSQNAITRDDDRLVPPFVTSQAPKVFGLARNVVECAADLVVNGVDPTLQKATAIHRASGELGAPTRSTPPRSMRRCSRPWAWRPPL